MLNENDESAFPVEVGQTCDELRGMSLLDWFAGQALAGFNWEDSGATYEKDAQKCFDMANAMMNERKRRNDERK
tara:strand:+ start:985 stop:1206 length:222 start_codon:yes stop_codon:yes gene_type:complete